MVALLRRQRLSLPLALVAAGALGVVIAMLVALIPMETLEGIVVDSGIAAVISAAEPPLGFTARIALMILAGGGVASFAWFGFYLIVGGRMVTIGKSDVDGVPVLRRADAHPDAPPRRPLFANQDLGTPFLDVKAPPVERELPADLDQPIAMFDPGALRAEPMAMPDPIAPLTRPPVFDRNERFETFELPVRSSPPPLRTPVYAPIEPPPYRAMARAPAPEPTPAPRRRVENAEAASIHALLDRLERGVVTREIKPNPPVAKSPRANDDSLQDTLGTLRRLATR